MVYHGAGKGGRVVKTLVVYDSVFGNTEKVAQRIATALPGSVKVTRVGGVSPADLGGLDFLVVGSPTLGGRATKPMQEFLNSLPRSVTENLRCAAFDTRIPMKFAQVFGYAAPRMAEELSSRGGAAVSGTEGFIVKGRGGPLADGELQRAGEWAKRLAAAGS